MILNSNDVSGGRRIGYARVSTDKQTLFQYQDMLEAAGCDPVFMDEAISAVAAHRPGLQRARADLKPGDTFVVPSIDRAFRSTLEGIQFLDALHREGIAFESIYQRIDTRTPEGRKWFIDSVNNAEYERAIISRRTREKMAAAKKRGVHLGRKPILADSDIRVAHRAINDDGVTLADVARHANVSVQTMRRSFRRLELTL
ncbi:recombinase family protein [Martelella radicis]|uniref:DNA invertase Pin-like site-specific DNA recombinase n=1 Tax=Martelella radicis TaxID=1397476 RepID=A0A7W6PBJ8_9HYPH|nr:recombinase family protein [Martelella radicis]MBB4123970.1 DNA invertase Pin-like site-specific DNA recombinase [Martelella radicis]